MIWLEYILVQKGYYQDAYDLLQGTADGKSLELWALKQFLARKLNKEDCLAELETAFKQSSHKYDRVRFIRYIPPFEDDNPRRFHQFYQRCLERGTLEAIEELWRRVSSDFKPSPEYYRLRGRARELMGKIDLASGDFRDSVLLLAESQDSKELRSALKYFMDYGLFSQIKSFWNRNLHQIPSDIQQLKRSFKGYQIGQPNADQILRRLRDWEVMQKDRNSFRKLPVYRERLFAGGRRKALFYHPLRKFLLEIQNADLDFLRNLELIKQTRSLIDSNMSYLCQYGFIREALEFLSTIQRLADQGRDEKLTSLTNHLENILNSQEYKEWVG